MISVYMPEGVRTRDTLESAYQLIAEKGGTQVYRWYDEGNLVEDFFNDTDEPMAQIAHSISPEISRLADNLMSMFQTISHRGK